MLFRVLLLTWLAGALAGDYYWHVRLGFASPDGFDRPVVIVREGAESNAHAFPPPTLRVVEGEHVRVHVTNDLPTHHITIHFHGQHFVGYPWSDGPAHITQCSISPGHSFTYEFIAGPSGTFFFHDHAGGKSADGLQGIFIVEPKTPEPFRGQYDEELEPLLLTDWYHTFSETQIAGLTAQRTEGRGFRWVGDPKSILFNGRAACPAALASNPCSDTSTGDCCDTERAGHYVFNVQQGRRYRLRVVGATQMSYLNFRIAGHRLTVVEADGTYIQPFEVDSLDVNSGERYSVIFTANQNIDNYWMSALQIYRGPVQGGAILRYVGAPAVDPSGSPSNPDATTLLAPVEPPAPASYDLSRWNPNNLKSLAGYSPSVPQGPADKTITYATAQSFLADYLTWNLNGVAQVEDPSLPLLQARYLGVEPDYDTLPPNASGLGRVVEHIPLGSVVDVVINNLAAANGKNEEHPWHMHGGYFWVLGTGIGQYNPAIHASTLNMVDPVYRDSTTVYPWGWLVIRFVANNPGVWLFHCHILWHLKMGMASTFVVGEPKDIPAPPSHYPFCGTRNSVCMGTNQYCKARSSINFYNYHNSGSCSGSNCKQ